MFCRIFHLVLTAPLMLSGIGPSSTVPWLIIGYLFDNLTKRITTVVIIVRIVEGENERLESKKLNSFESQEKKHFVKWGENKAVQWPQDLSGSSG